jgi:hypothetical protein
MVFLKLVKRILDTDGHGLKTDKDGFTTEFIMFFHIFFQ